MSTSHPLPTTLSYFLRSCNALTNSSFVTLGSAFPLVVGHLTHKQIADSNSISDYSVESVVQILWILL